jgi:putative iron-dependent peroxidase
VIALPAAFSVLTNTLPNFQGGFTPIPHYGLDYSVTLPKFPEGFTPKSASEIGAILKELLSNNASIYVLGNYTYDEKRLDYVHFNNYFVEEESENNYSQQDGAILVYKNGAWRGLFLSFNRQLQSYTRTHGDATTVPILTEKLYMACGTEAVDTHPAETAKLLYLRNLPQHGVITYPTPHQLFVVVHLRRDYVRNEVVNALVKIPRTYPNGCLVDANTLGIFFYVDWLQGNNPGDRLEISIGFSPELWIAWGQDVPKNMTHFHARTTADGKHTMPATGGDIVMHLKGSRPELLQDISDRFKELIHSQQEIVQVFPTYNGPKGRNLFGFFDAPTLNNIPPCGMYQRVTQNPVLCIGPIESVTDRGRMHTSLIGEEDPSHLNGSFFLTQLFTFRMDKFNRLSEDEQSNVFGRDKQTGYFLNSAITNAVAPPSIPFCHVIRSSISLDDPPTKFAHIYRQAGSLIEQGKNGLFFVAYVSDSKLFDQTLDQMMGLVKPVGKPQGVDTMMDFVDTLSGQYFYVPNLSRLFNLWTAEPHQH